MASRLSSIALVPSLVLVFALGAQAQDAPPPADQPTPPPGYEQQQVIQPYQGPPVVEQTPSQGYGEAPQPLYVEQPTQPTYVQPVPAQTEPIGYESRPRVGLIIAGALIFTIPYVIGVTFAASTDNAGWLAIPVAGPFLQMMEVDGDFADLANIGLAFWGLVQAVGVTLFTLGFVLSEETPVYAELERETGIAVRPWFAPDRNGGAQGGLSLSTRF